MKTAANDQRLRFPPGRVGQNGPLQVPLQVGADPGRRQAAHWAAVPGTYPQTRSLTSETQAQSSGLFRAPKCCACCPGSTAQLPTLPSLAPQLREVTSCAGHAPSDVTSCPPQQQHDTTPCPRRFFLSLSYPASSSATTLKTPPLPAVNVGWRLYPSTGLF